MAASKTFTKEELITLKERDNLHLVIGGKGEFCSCKAGEKVLS